MLDSEDGMAPKGDAMATEHGGGRPPRATIVSGVAEESVPTLFALAARAGGGIERALAELKSPVAVSDSTPAMGLPAIAADLSEHTSMHIAIEGVSLIAARIIQDARFVSTIVPAEIFVEDGIVELAGATEELRQKLNSAALSLRSAHDSLLERAVERIVVRDKCSADEARSTARSLALGLVPAATRTNVYITVNARSLAVHLGKLLAHSLPEMRAIGRAILTSAREVLPKLFAAVEPSRIRAAAPVELSKAVARFYASPQEGTSATMVISQPVRLVRHDKDALDRIMLALAYEASDSSVNAFALMGGLRGAKEPALVDVLRAVLQDRARDETVPRAFEVSTMTFEIMVDAATLHELLRPRLHSASTQRLTCRLGFHVPDDLLDLGLAEPYQDAMLTAQAAWSEIADEDPSVAEYAVPLGYRARSLWTIDMRQLLHVIETRSAKSNPMRVRRVAHGLYRTASGVLAWLRDVARVDME